MDSDSDSQDSDEEDLIGEDNNNVMANYTWGHIPFVALETENRGMLLQLKYLNITHGHTVVKKCQGN